jgi:hypothetical protein
MTQGRVAGSCSYNDIPQTHFPPSPIRPILSISYGQLHEAGTKSQMEYGDAGYLFGELAGNLKLVSGCSVAHMRFRMDTQWHDLRVSPFFEQLMPLLYSLTPALFCQAHVLP